MRRLQAILDNTLAHILQLAIVTDRSVAASICALIVGNGVVIGRFYAAFAIARNEVERQEIDKGQVTRP